MAGQRKKEQKQKPLEKRQRSTRSGKRKQREEEARQRHEAVDVAGLDLAEDLDLQQGQGSESEDSDDVDIPIDDDVDELVGAEEEGDESDEDDDDDDDEEDDGEEEEEEESAEDDDDEDLDFEMDDMPATSDEEEDLGNKQHRARASKTDNGKSKKKKNNGKVQRSKETTNQGSSTKQQQKNSDDEHEGFEDQQQQPHLQPQRRSRPVKSVKGFAGMLSAMMRGDARPQPKEKPTPEWAKYLKGKAAQAAQQAEGLAADGEGMAEIVTRGAAAAAARAPSDEDDDFDYDEDALDGAHNEAAEEKEQKKKRRRKKKKKTKKQNPHLEWGRPRLSSDEESGDDSEDGPSERILEWMGRAPRFEIVDVDEYTEKLRRQQQDSEDEQFGGPAEGDDDNDDDDDYRPARRVYDVETGEFKTLSDIFSKAPDSEQYLKEKQERRERIQQRMRELQSRKPMQVVSSDTDTSDDEHSRNTVGQIPMEWYKDYNHLGYDRSGKKISKLSKAKDRLDKFLERMEHGGAGRTVFDPVTGDEIELSDETINLIKKIQAGELPSDPYEEYVDFFTSDVQRVPVTGRPEPKSRFVPSKWEHKQVMKLVRRIRRGKIKIKGDEDEEEEEEEPEFYDLWGQDDKPHRSRTLQIPAPKMTLPDHDESYNPPPEYLPTEELRARIERTPKAERKQYYIPTKFSSLRAVPAYDMFLRERFERCLDLYLCPRTRKVRKTVKAESLLPKLPNPKDLQPFPTAVSLSYVGHTDIVTSISVDPTGQWLFSGSEDCTMRIWEVATGRCCKVYKLKEPVLAVAANPNPELSLVAVTANDKLYIINHGLSSKAVASATKEFAKRCKNTGAHKNKRITVRWTNGGGDTVKDPTVVYTITHRFEVTKLAWHHRGNYLASVMPDGSYDAVAIHSIGKQATQYPFRKKNNDIQDVRFHPKLPIFYVATKTRVRIYNLQTQTLVKKLQTGVKWISSMDVHPGGDNLIIGSYDRRLSWFDTDLSLRPYKTLRYHRYALRNVTYHRQYPLFASCSDDGSVHVFHGRVYNDLLQNPLIVPVKILKGHRRVKDLGVLDCTFHPRQPWLFSAGADGIIKLYT